jgi:hypothetical protein
LKAPIQGFEALQSVQQLQTCLAHMYAGFHKLFCVPDRELDSVNRNTNLIGRFEFYLGGPQPHLCFDGFDNLMHDFCAQRLSSRAFKTAARRAKLAAEEDRCNCSVAFKSRPAMEQ